MDLSKKGQNLKILKNCLVGEPKASHLKKDQVNSVIEENHKAHTLSLSGKLQRMQFLTTTTLVPTTTTKQKSCSILWTRVALISLL